MQYRKDQKNGNELSALGFGCMRFPTSGGRIDVDASEELILRAVDNGINYLDTAYAYSGNETALNEIFSRNPGLREKVLVATKLPIVRCESNRDFDTYLARSLERLGINKIDYFLIHNITSANTWDRLESMGIEEWIAEQKDAGRIDNIGFSYHGSEGDFPILLDAYDWDFCQIQFNYMNEHYQAGTAGLEAAGKRGIPVIVMEPLLGGKLAADLPKNAQEALSKAGESDNAARLALRWIWNHPQVTVVLSGMNEMKQLEENLSTVENALPGSLTKAETEAVELARESIADNYKIACTGCGYCMPCPKEVNIPMCFASYNASFAHDWFQGIKQYVTASGAMSGDAHYASDCVQCGACVKKCPQHINIPLELKSVKRRLQPPGMPFLLHVGTRIMSK